MYGGGLALMKHLIMAKIDGFRVTSTVFHCHQDEDIFKTLFNRLGVKDTIFKPKIPILGSFQALIWFKWMTALLLVQYFTAVT